MLGTLGCFASLTVHEPEGHLQLGGVRLCQGETAGKGMRQPSVKTQCPPPGNHGDNSNHQ